MGPICINAASSPRSELGLLLPPGFSPNRKYVTLPPGIRYTPENQPNRHQRDCKQPLQKKQQLNPAIRGAKKRKNEKFRLGRPPASKTTENAPQSCKYQPPRHGFDSSFGSARLLEQDVESRLLEMMIARQSVGQAMLPHHRERDTIGQRPGLVGAAGVKIKPPLK